MGKDRPDRSSCAWSEEQAIPIDDLVDALVADLRPVRPVLAWPALVGVVLAATLVAGIMAVAPGWRADFRLGYPAAIAATRTFVLALATVPLMMAAISAARPGAAIRPVMRTGVLLLAALPTLALVSLATAPSWTGEWAAALPELAGGLRCLMLALGCAVPTLAVLAGWTRRFGAVTDPRGASVAEGLAAGTVGVAIYSLTCPSQHWLFAGLVYPSAIAVTTLLARAVLPRVLRW